MLLRILQKCDRRQRTEDRSRKTENRKQIFLPSVLRPLSSGFTLIEVLIGVAILAFIMTMVWTNTRQSIRAKERIEKRGDVYHDARVTLGKMVHDISMSYLVSGEAHVGKKADHQTIQTAFHGRDSGKEDSLSFVALSHMRLFRSARESDSAEISYKVERYPDKPDGLQLLRRESNWVDDKPEEGGEGISPLDFMNGMELEYYDADKKEWTAEWNSESGIRKGKLQRAVRITLMMQDPDHEEEEIPFKTMAMIEMYKNAIDF